MPKKPYSQNEVVEEQPEIESEQLINKIHYFPEGKHIWRQEGPYIVCRNCPLHHAVYIGMDKIMVGEEEDGKPIMKDRASI